MLIPFLILAITPVAPDVALIRSGWGDAQVVTQDRKLCVLTATPTDVLAMCLGVDEIAQLTAWDASLEPYRATAPTEATDDLDVAYWDLNRDGALNVGDLQASLAAESRSCPQSTATCFPDIDGAGAVDGRDIERMLSRLLTGRNCEGVGLCFSRGE